MANRVLVVVPVFNEEDNISNVVRDINEVKIKEGIDIEILVVNDCSTDDTLKIIEKLDCNFLNLPVNLGIGGAVQSGFKFAQLNNFDYMVQLDGDGQHPSSELIKILTPAFQKDADIIIGSRFIDKRGFQSTFIRRIGITYFRFLNRILTRVNINDSTSGFRIFNRKAIDLASKYYPDEYPEPEVIVYFLLKGLTLKEIPVIMKERQGGKSSIDFIKSIYYMIKVSLGVLFVYFKFK